MSHKIQLNTLIRIMFTCTGIFFALSALCFVFAHNYFEKLSISQDIIGINENNIYLMWLKIIFIGQILLSCIGILIFLFFAVVIYKNLNFEKENIKELYNKDIEKKNKLIKNLSKLYNNVIEYDRHKTDFFSNISHELKTPLSVILGAIQLMDRRNSSLPIERRRSGKQLKTIKQNCYRLLRLVNNFLDITKIDSGYIKTNFTNCNIVYIVEEITQSVVPFAQQKGLTMQFDTQVEEVTTAVDMDKIERVLLNLLSNAIKFTPTGGDITVNVCERLNKIAISIKDSGVGIPKNKLNSIFERFRQVNSSLTRENEGSGIGLSLVKSFIDLHDGSITVNSEENRGSEFIIELPIKPIESSSIEVNNTPQKEHDKIIESIRIELADIYKVAS